LELHNHPVPSCTKIHSAYELPSQTFHKKYAQMGEKVGRKCVASRQHNFKQGERYYSLGHYVVSKLGSFTQCAVRQHTHRAEVFSLLHICTDMGAR